MTTRTSSKRLGVVHGYRSGLEEQVARQLAAAGIDAEYESVVIPYVKPERTAKYTPDFPLPNGIIVETKGRWLTEDRQKMALIKVQHPDLDIRLVFSRAATTISKASKTTYAMWAAKHGYKWADKLIPQEWLDEPPNERRLKALRAL